MKKTDTHLTGILRFRRAYERGIVLAVGIFSWYVRYRALRQTSYANGWDGYYYLVQLKALVEEGSMHSPDVSLIYPFLVMLHALTNNYLLAFKLAAALLAGVYSVTVYYLAKKLLLTQPGGAGASPHQDSVRLIPLLLALFSVYSPSLTFLSAQFPKNLLGFIAFNLFLISILHAIGSMHGSRRQRYRSLLLVGVAFVLTIFSHRMATALSMIVLAGMVLWYTVRQKKYSLLYAGAALAAVVLAASFLFPGVLHLYDLKRFEGLFAGVPQLAPLSFIRLLGEEKFSLLWLMELGGLYLLLVFFLFYILYYFFLQKAGKAALREHASYTAIALLSFVMVFPFFNFNLMGIAYRFLFCFLLMTPLLFIPLLRKIPVMLCYGIAAGLCILSFFSLYSYQPTAFDPPYQYYETLSLRAGQLLEKRPQQLVVAHKALAELYTFTVGRDALPWQPEKSYDYRAVWRIAAGIDDAAYSRYLEDAARSVTHIKGRYYLIREDRWQEFVKKVKAARNTALLATIYSWENPYQMRPGFITRGRDIR